MIRGFIETSCSDWPGKVTAVIFLAGCNFRCPYCHNHSLVLAPEFLEPITEKRVLERLAALGTWLDGVCVSGGEPTLRPELPDLCRRLRAAGLAVKLDTNGSRPRMVEALLTDGLVDFVAMDIKAPLRRDRYERCAGATVDLEAIRESMELLVAAGIPRQFRVTYHPSLFPAAELADLGDFLHRYGPAILQKADPRPAPAPWFRRLPSMKEEQFQDLIHVFSVSRKTSTAGEKND
ncbi:MAG: anaerobic ribonucleoside-triphosphate reductase activating protein [Deltaproteobacteria bacterium]|nr:anaerobic ribonucleoside-triphosphate reductase activating protein [Candidatus Anaeroferrophillacea bacterium]